MKLFQVEPKKFSNERETIQESMRKLQASSEFPDFMIIAGDQTFACHKAILANKSKILKTMLLSEKFLESKKNELTIDDFDPEVVRLMIHFVYCHELPNGAQCSIE